jgi:hypothetical protein
MVTRHHPRSVSKAAAVYAAIPAIAVPIVGLASAIGVSGALQVNVWLDGFGLILGGWLAGGQSRYNGTLLR